jgi:ankyrin repeat protein
MEQSDRFGVYSFRQMEFCLKPTRDRRTVTRKTRLFTLSVTLTGLVCVTVLAFFVIRSVLFAKHTFNPPLGTLNVGFRETAAHRPTPAPVPVFLKEDMPESVDLWLHIDSQGRVLDMQGIDEPVYLVTQVRQAVKSVRYVPFTQNGRPVDAWAQDTFELIATPRRPIQTVPFPRTFDPAKVVIQLARSGCFGTCPSYSVSIRGDGEVTYNGRSSVSIPGPHSAHIDPSAVSALVERFRAANFLALQDSYRAGVTDNPTYCLSLNLSGKAKVVIDYVGEWVGMPPEVTQLEEAVDQVSDSARWVSASSDTPDAMRQAGISFASDQATLILRVAVEAGNIGTVRSLLEAGTPLDTPLPTTPGTPGLFAARFSRSLPDLAIVSHSEPARLKMLQTVLASPAVRADKPGLQQALASTAKHGDVDLARTLIASGADPSARLTGDYDSKDETYLMLAAASGVWAMLDDALARPHNIRAVDAQGHTALVDMVWSAPQKEDIFPLVDRLLAAGADRSELDRVLLDTCQPNWIPGLVARGGNINARDTEGNTPLFQSCSDEGVKAMLDAGADPALRNHAGKTAVEAIYPPEGGKEDSRAKIIQESIDAKAAIASSH